jgi:large subunit ribosomal protein L23
MISKYVIKSPIISEKSTAEAAATVPHYYFLVEKEATKGEIKTFLKEVLGVEALSVRTAIVPRKSKRVASKARLTSFRPSYKKAIVVLKKGQKLDLFEK